MPVKTPIEEEYVTPGPSHYNPRDTMTSPATPRYSMLGRDVCVTSHTLPYPSPADRDISSDPLHTQPGFSQKGKGITWPYAPKKNFHITTSPGPNVNLLYDNVGSSETGATLSSRHKHGIIHGYPGTFAQPVDTLGFHTPGPAKYTPHPTDSLPGVKKSLGVKLPSESAHTCTPGAGTYEIISSFDATEVGHQFGRRLGELSMDNSPSPNTYYLPSTNNTNISYTLQSSNKPVYRSGTAAPNSYVISGVNQTGGKYSRTTGLQYRTFEPDPFPAPTPATYNTDIRPFLTDTSPLHANRCLPVFPDILHYPEFSTLSTPAPSIYQPSLSLTRPLDPSYSFGTPFHYSRSLTPAPNRYNIQDIKTSKHRHGSSYTMRPRTVDPYVDNTKQDIPGPSDYTPSEIKVSAPFYSFGTKHSHEDKLNLSMTPADLSPNTYHIPDNLSRRGVTRTPAYSIKGKLSPKVYNGFSNSSILHKLSTIN